jgi:hypothetical protein
VLAASPTAVDLGRGRLSNPAGVPRDDRVPGRGAALRAVGREAPVHDGGCHDARIRDRQLREGPFADDQGHGRVHLAAEFGEGRVVRSGVPAGA